MNETAATAINWNTVILAVIGLAGTTLTSIITYLTFKLRYSAAQTLINSEITRQSASATAVSVEKVHVAVNSERTAMMAEVKKLRDEIRDLAVAKATLEEQRRHPEDTA